MGTGVDCQIRGKKPGMGALGALLLGAYLSLPQALSSRHILRNFSIGISLEVVACCQGIMSLVSAVVSASLQTR